MAGFKALAGLSAAAILLAGCSTLWPSLTGEDPSGEEERVEIPASAAEANVDPVYGEVARESESMAAGGSSADGSLKRVAYEPESELSTAQPTGTFVGGKVFQQRGELDNLRFSIRSRQDQFGQLRNTARQNSQGYFATVAAITARLRIGTTPGNPVLVSQWNAAQSELDRILTDIAALNTLGNQVAADSAMSAYLLEAVRATYGLQGAVDEDHRQLALIEDEVNRSVVLIDRMLSEVQETITRYTDYVNAERRNLTSLALAIKNGEYIGPSLSNRSVQFATTQSSVQQQAAPLEPQIALADRRPLVIIRFDRTNVEYRQALYSAISTALERRPSSTFDLIAIAPNQGSPADVALSTNAAKRNAEQVLQALTEMGLPSSRVALSSTTSPSVQTNEVHIYIR
jgi:hypothetical protein